MSAIQTASDEQVAWAQRCCDEPDPDGSVGHFTADCVRPLLARIRQEQAESLAFAKGLAAWEARARKAEAKADDLERRRTEGPWECVYCLDVIGTGDGHWQRCKEHPARTVMAALREERNDLRSKVDRLMQDLAYVCDVLKDWGFYDLVSGVLSQHLSQWESGERPRRTATEVEPGMFVVGTTPPQEVQP